MQKTDMHTDLWTTWSYYGITSSKSNSTSNWKVSTKVKLIMNYVQHFYNECWQRPTYWKEQQRLAESHDLWLANQRAASLTSTCDLFSGANQGLEAERANLSCSLLLVVDSGTALELPVLRSPARQEDGSSLIFSIFSFPKRLSGLGAKPGTCMHIRGKQTKTSGC